jgi:signal transduction histidine kinase
MIIKDDGKGFDLSAASNGNGLKNIRYRAEQIHSVAKIVSSPGSGTIVIITKK